MQPAVPAQENAINHQGSTLRRESSIPVNDTSGVSAGMSFRFGTASRKTGEMTDHFAVLSHQG
jgi:hypothetical protein